MKNISFLLIIIVLSGCASKPRLAENLTQSILLPDGKYFPFWDDHTVYKKVYYVDQGNKKASDENSGTEDSPFLTINQAARVAMPGEKIAVKRGIYRENVCPARGGENEQSMICYEAAPDAEVIISGSEVLKEKWVNSRTPYNPGQPFSQKLWMTSIPQSYFKEANPFMIQNADENEMKVMSWAKDWTNRVPYTLVTGLIFQDGERMSQLAAYEDIVKLPGSYWVDTTHNDINACTIHIHPFADKDPNKQYFEITTRQSPFNPKVKGINFIRVKGFIIEQAGNGFQRSGKGAFSTYGGNHWIIEDNIFRKINSVAVEIGAATDEHLNEGTREELEAKSGRHIVRNNTIFDCGTGGIQGLINIENLVENNHLFDIGWQEAEYYWETAAIKLLETHNCLIRKNHIHNIDAAMGIWLDWDNINSRVTRNLIYDVSCAMGGIFIEASLKPNLVDNNLVWNCSKNGIYQHDCDSLIIVHNIIGQSKENGVMMTLNEGRRKPGGGFFTARNNKVLNNLLIDNTRPFSYSDTINISDYNIVSSSGGKDIFDWNEWNRKGFDKNSRKIKIAALFNEPDLIFTLKTKDELPKVYKLTFIKEDFLGRKYDEQNIAPGALKDVSNEIIQLSRYFRIKK
jgi:alpha-L-arabinofuranosidase